MIRLDKIPSHKFLIKLMHDPSISIPVKKRIIMYVNGDKRISKRKLILDLHVACPLVGGSGEDSNIIFKFGIDSPKYRSGTASPMDLPSPTGPFTFGIGSPNINNPTPKKITQANVAINPEGMNARFFISQMAAFTNFAVDKPLDVYTNKSGTKTLTIDEIIGSGSFANVYKIANEPTLCIKLFKNNNDEGAIQLCIRNFLSSCKAYIQYTSFHFGTLEDIWYSNSQNNSGYITTLMHGSLTDLFSLIDVPQLDIIHSKTLAILKNNCFIHGDVKLDNILYRNHTREYDVKLHDFDTVYVYDAETLLHDSDKPFKTKMSMTPLSTHPFFMTFTKCLATATNKSELITSLNTFTYDDIMNRWKLIIAIVTQNCNPAEIENIKSIIDSLLSLVERFLDFKTRSGNINVDWLRNMMQHFDLYSYGASLIVYGSSKGESNTDICKRVVMLGQDVISSQRGGLDKVLIDLDRGMPPLVFEKLNPKDRRAILTRPLHISEPVKSPRKDDDLYTILNQKIVINPHMLDDQFNLENQSDNIKDHYQKLFMHEHRK